MITQRNVVFFSDFQYGFRSSGSTSDLLTVVSYGISRALNRFGVTQAVALNVSKAFGKVWCAGFHKLKFYGISGQLCLFSVIDGFEWFWMGSLHKNIQLMLEFLKALFLVPLFFYSILMTLRMLSVILLTMLIL